jgi:hypothetical protein
MQARIAAARQREVAALRRQQFLGATNMWIGYFVPSAVTVASFYAHTKCVSVPGCRSAGGVRCTCAWLCPRGAFMCVCVWPEPGQGCLKVRARRVPVCVFRWADTPLDAATAFASLAWFDILRTPLFTLPYVIQTLVQITISFKCVHCVRACVAAALIVRPASRGM